MRDMTLSDAVAFLRQMSNRLSAAADALQCTTSLNGGDLADCIARSLSRRSGRVADLAIEHSVSPDAIKEVLGHLDVEYTANGWVRMKDVEGPNGGG